MTDLSPALSRPCMASPHREAIFAAFPPRFLALFPYSFPFYCQEINKEFRFSPCVSQAKRVYYRRTLNK